MIFPKNLSVLLACLFFLVFAPSIFAHGEDWQMLHGDVLQVFPEQQKIMIMREGQKQILELDPDCQILRNGSPTSLESLRPVFAQSYQDVLCWLNNQGFISYILANYSVEEVDGSLVSRDIFGNVK